MVKKLSVEHKRKISNSLRDKPTSRVPKTAFKSGRTPWNKGNTIKPLTQEHKDKISEANIGKHLEQLEEDSYREQQITNEIGCSFLRIPTGD